MLSSRSEAIKIAQEKLANKPLFLDTETTGLDNFSEIVEICIVEHDGEILYESLVKPTRSIPFDAVRIHGISDPVVQNAPSWIQVWAKMAAPLHRHLHQLDYHQHQNVGYNVFVHVAHPTHHLTRLKATNLVTRIPTKHPNHHTQTVLIKMCTRQHFPDQITKHVEEHQIDPSTT